MLRTSFEEVDSQRRKRRLTYSHHEISRSLRPTDLKFGRHVPFMEQISAKNEICENLPPRWFVRYKAELAERWTELPQVSDESRSFFIVHTGYFSNIPKCIKAEFIASWACSQSSVVSSSQR
ncbi:hypothetical protein TNCV_5056181 [Trichonephila clavipes]|nr:hypothetical protein TNCV_5056181 [Trichonephila clavipes]